LPWNDDAGISPAHGPLIATEQASRRRVRSGFNHRISRGSFVYGKRRKALFVSAALVGGTLLMTARQDADAGTAQGSAAAVTAPSLGGGSFHRVSPTPAFLLIRRVTRQQEAAERAVRL
jgi:hypothetical protein